MICRLALNGLQRRPLMSIASALFTAASTALMALTLVMSCQLFGSIQNLMDQALVPDILQMHSGKADENQIAAFAGQCEAVEDWHLSSFLNLDNTAMNLSGHSLASNSQDNGLCIQSERFDFLLDLAGNIADPEPGEVYVPVAYRSLYDVKPGDDLIIGNRTLKIAGFIRDAQMNAMMCSSKRFLVHKQTLEQFRNDTQEETLIEFMLKPDVRPSVFQQMYEEAGLPSSGPFIDRSLILVMNALSDGTVIFLLFLISVAVIAISILCIRYILALQLEEDRKATGMMKALGIRHKALYRIYLVRYLFLAVPGVLTGIIAALIFSRPMMRQIQELYGAAPAGPAVPAACLVAALVCSGILLLSVRISLKAIRRQSPLDALRNINEPSRSRPGLMSAAVCAGCTFLILVPLFLANTLADPSFVTNMGIGNARLRLDFSTEQQAAEALDLLKNDEEIDQWTMLDTYGEKALLSDGSESSLPVEVGNHQIFPVAMAEGELPSEENELALSMLFARESGLRCQDQIRLEGYSDPFIICGIYSDITNGGKTAKAAVLNTEASSVWQVAYVTLTEEADEEEWMKSIRKNGVRVISIPDYVSQTYAQTLNQLSQACLLAAVTGIFILLAVLFLAVRLSALQNSQTLSLKKALGFTAERLKKEWFIKEALWCAGGTAAGMLLAVWLGERICAFALYHLGAAGFHFEIPWLQSSGLLLLILFSSMISVWSGLAVISRISPCECVRGKESL